MKELRIQMTMYIPIKENETEEDMLNELDKVAYDNNMSYNIQNTKIQEEGEL